MKIQIPSKMMMGATRPLSYPYQFSKENAKIQVLKSQFYTPWPQADIFAFFAQAENLQILTPPQLDFKILTPTPIQMRAGLQIDYALRLYGLPLHWRSLIPIWEPPYRFIDLQQRGPYLLWEHEHRFEQVAEGGTLITDIIRYRAPGPDFIHTLFVRPNLKRIFGYRYQVMQARFGVL